MMKNKGFKILFGISVVLVIADVISTLLNGELVQYLEVNPIYKYGGISLIILLNALIYYYFWWVYHRKREKVDDRYFAILAMCFIVFMRITVIIGNLQVAYEVPQEIAEESNITIAEAKEVQLEYAKTVTDEQKLQYMKDLMIPNLLPYVIALVAWIIYRMDHEVEAK